MITYHGIYIVRPLDGYRTLHSPKFIMSYRGSYTEADKRIDGLDKILMSLDICGLIYLWSQHKFN